jgi:hypothetical protein
MIDDISGGGDSLERTRLRRIPCLTVKIQGKLSNSVSAQENGAQKLPAIFGFQADFLNAGTENF